MTEFRNGRRVLTTPVSIDDIAALHIGDVFYLDGEMVTGRDSVHGRVVDEGLEMPIDIRGKVIMHAGPIVKKTSGPGAPAPAHTASADESVRSPLSSPAGTGNITGNDCPSGSCRYEMVAVGPTTSMRMERFEYEFIRETGVRIIIGKGGMKDRTAAGCREFGAIHCVLPAGNAVMAATSVEEIMDVKWLDLGMPEACWHCRVREFGPLIVSIDSCGRNFFEEKKVEYNRRREEQLERIRPKLHYMK